MHSGSLRLSTLCRLSCMPLSRDRLHVSDITSAAVTHAHGKLPATNQIPHVVSMWLEAAYKTSGKSIFHERVQPHQ